MSTTQTIQWKRLSVEAIVIVASILLAFSIDTPSPFDTSGYALQGLLASGNLEIIADDELRSALIA